MLDAVLPEHRAQDFHHVVIRVGRLVTCGLPRRKSQIEITESPIAAVVNAVVLQKREAVLSVFLQRADFLLVENLDALRNGSNSGDKHLSGYRGVAYLHAFLLENFLSPHTFVQALERGLLGRAANPAKC